MVLLGKRRPYYCRITLFSPSRALSPPRSGLQHAGSGRATRRAFRRQRPQLGTEAWASFAEAFSTPAARAGKHGLPRGSPGAEQGRESPLPAPARSELALRRGGLFGRYDRMFKRRLGGGHQLKSEPGRGFPPSPFAPLQPPPTAWGEQGRSLPREESSPSPG